MSTHTKNVKLFTGNANPKLAQNIANLLDIPLGKCRISTFSDGETRVRIDETVRGASVYAVQTLSEPVNTHIMELLIMIDAMKRASAANITAVIPYFAYARQDRKARAREPISAKLLANIIQAAGADKVLTMDLHASQLQGFFDIPVDHIYGIPLLAKYFEQLYREDISNLTAVAPDLGGVNRCRSLADKLNIPLAIIDKRRPHPNVSEVLNIVGDVEGRDIVIVDDIIDTAGTLCNAAEALAQRGAAKIYACATHAILSGNGVENIMKSPICEVAVLDTVILPPEKRVDKITQLSAAAIFAEVIERINDDVSVSALFK